MSDQITLRPVCAADETFLYQVYASTRADEMALMDWTDAQKAAFLQMQFHAQRQHYLTYYPEATYAIICQDGLACGRLILNRTEDEILLIDIALLPMQRNLSIGTQLIQALQAEAEAADKRVRLHVHNFSSAIRLYRRLGFTNLAEKDFYLEMEWRPAHGPSGIWPIRHETLGQFDLFLVSSGRDEEGLYYEAVFNRLLPRNPS